MDQKIMLMVFDICSDATVESYVICFFFQAEDGIRDLVRSRGLGDVYKRQPPSNTSRLEARSGALPLCCDSHSVAC